MFLPIKVNRLIDKIKRIAKVFPVNHVTLRTPHSRYIGMLMIPVKKFTTARFAIRMFGKVRRVLNPGKNTKDKTITKCCDSSYGYQKYNHENCRGRDIFDFHDFLSPVINNTCLDISYKLSRNCHYNWTPTPTTPSEEIIEKRIL